MIAALIMGFGFGVGLALVLALPGGKRALRRLLRADEEEKPPKP